MSFGVVGLTYYLPQKYGFVTIGEKHKYQYFNDFQGELNINWDKVLLFVLVGTEHMMILKKLKSKMHGRCSLMPRAIFLGLWL